MINKNNNNNYNKEENYFLSQKIPQKFKKRSNELKDSEKSKCLSYYSELENFILNNQNLLEKKSSEIKYIFDFDPKKKIFYSSNYDPQNFLSFGFYDKAKKTIFLSREETFYLSQIGQIKINTDYNFADNDDIIKLNLYSYLRRSGNIPVVCSLFYDYEKTERVEDVNKYFILFKDMERYKQKKIDAVLYQNDWEEKLNFCTFDKIIKNSEILWDYYKNFIERKELENKKNSKEEKININKEIKDKYDVNICITKGITITFLKIKKANI